MVEDVFDWIAVRVQLLQFFHYRNTTDIGEHVYSHQVIG